MSLTAVKEKHGCQKAEGAHMIRVTIWYEYAQECGVMERRFVPEMSDEDYAGFEAFVKSRVEKMRAVYPKGLMGTLAGALSEDPELQITMTNIFEPEYGLPDELLENTDVLVWWSHILQDAIPDALAFKIVQRVQKGMGFVPLHSAHKSKPFMYLLGTSGCLKWREDDFCRVWTAAPGHPIAQGIPESFELEEEEMYGEPFDIPRPDDNIFISWYSGGELFRSGCTWTRGYGRIFYFQPGHETSPNYHNPYVQRIIRQGIRWAAPRTWRENFDCPNILDAPEARRKRGEQADGQPTL